MTTRRGEAHRWLVRYEKCVKKISRTEDPITQGFYALGAAMRRCQYVWRWKEAKKHAGNGQHSR